MQWNNQQEQALKDVDKWFYTESKKKQIFRIFGYAGTGKTTLARHFAENIDGTVAFAAFTGKAALMMGKNGCEGASTIHSLIYKTHEDNKGRISFSLNKASTIKQTKLLIIDECSMVNDKIAKDLLSFNVPILVLGDPAQLPPVTGTGFFTDCKPDVMLTEIHRQAKDNPIIHLATMVRQGKQLKLGNYGESKIVSAPKAEFIIDSDQIIVGKNDTRVKLNRIIRNDFLEISSKLPVQGDKLICLRNDHEIGIYNGGMFITEHIYDINKEKDKEYITMNLEHEDDDHGSPTIVKVHKSFFDDTCLKPSSMQLKESQQFDFGYAITCHKSQGSQWDNVLVYDESWVFRDDRDRWLYTAISRAAEKVIVVK